jgi:hypothetical protein
MASPIANALVLACNRICCPTTCATMSMSSATCLRSTTACVTPSRRKRARYVCEHAHVAHAHVAHAHVARGEESLLTVLAIGFGGQKPAIAQPCDWTSHGQELETARHSYSRSHVIWHADGLDCRNHRESIQATCTRDIAGQRHIITTVEAVTNPLCHLVKLLLHNLQLPTP